ncbi:hypothetical protein ES705_47890 [subsurface metagenome]
MRNLKNIRSTFINADKITIPATGSEDGVGATFIAQDKLRVIGFDMDIEARIDDGASNTDGFVEMISELSRSGQRSRDGSLGREELLVVWNGILSIGGELRKTKTVMFPDGCGYDMDEGEILNLLHYCVYTGTDTVDFYQNCLIYWVER